MWSAPCPGHATWNRAPEPISFLWSREKYSELYAVHFKVQTDKEVYSTIVCYDYELLI